MERAHPDGFFPIVRNAYCPPMRRTASTSPRFTDAVALKARSE